MNITPKYAIDAKVYITYSPNGIWSGRPCKVVAVREGRFSYLYDVEFQYNGQPTLLKDYDEHSLNPCYE